MFKISVEKQFSAAHRLVGYQGVCNKTHGHNWKVRVVVTTEMLDDIGISVDFKILDDLLDQVIGRLDHQFLNEIEPFEVQNPTAENLAVYIFDSIKDKLPEGVQVAAVEVTESNGYAVTYEP